MSGPGGSPRSFVFRKRALRLFLLVAALLPASFAAAQVALSELTIHNTPMPKAFLRQPYKWKFEAEGGVPPLRWQLAGGDLPDGLTLADDGTLTGRPLHAGEFHFAVSASDSAHPPKEKTLEFVLTVVIPLQVEWSRPAKIVGRRIEGAVRTSNGTEQDFDLTVVVVAVNQDGRATAIGYQRITLQKDQEDLEIPFGENLPTGTYEVNVDAVGEVAATNTIYRARLVSDKLTMPPEQ
jgi:hypothetical protein